MEYGGSCRDAVGDGGCEWHDQAASRLFSPLLMVDGSDIKREKWFPSLEDDNCGNGG